MSWHSTQCTHTPYGCIVCVCSHVVYTWARWTRVKRIFHWDNKMHREMSMPKKARCVWINRLHRTPPHAINNNVRFNVFYSYLLESWISLWLNFKCFQISVTQEQYQVAISNGSSKLRATQLRITNADFFRVHTFYLVRLVRPFFVSIRKMCFLLI